MKEKEKRSYSEMNNKKMKVKGKTNTKKHKISYPGYLIKYKDSEVIPSQIVYLKHMRFANDNSLDCKMKGRPFLVFDVDDNNAHLYKISSSKPFGTPKYPIYHEIILSKKRNTHNKKSYVDLRYDYVMDREELEEKITAEAEPVLGKYISYKVEIIDEKDYIAIKNSIDYLKRINLLKTSYQSLDEDNKNS